MTRLVFGRPGVVLAPGTYARLRPIDANTVALESSFDANFVAAFKSAVPPAMRRWEAANKRWIVDSAYARCCADLAASYLGVQVQIPTVGGGVAAQQTRLVRLEYLGRTKERADGESTATGYADGTWSIVFPEKVLRDWFEGPLIDDAAPREAPTLYAMLAIRPAATLDDVKSAYRRMAKLTHPDVNKEPDAAEQFRVIQAAYEILANPIMRRRYDVGLVLEAEAKRDDRTIGRQFEHDGYRSPLRCGLLLANGRERLGQFHVEEVLQWESILNAKGQELVTSWPRGAQDFVSVWVDV